MYKYFKAKYIVPALILIITITLVLFYFVGALSVGAVTHDDNLEFDLTEFIDASTITTPNLKKRVAENANFRMYFNEDTTVLTIVKLENGVETQIVYNSAIPSVRVKAEDGVSYVSDPIELTLDGSSVLESKKVTSQMQSNFVLYYLDAKGNRVTSTLNAMANSVAFKNDLTGTTDKHYFIRYIPEENAVQVCYQIGKFGSSSDYFPKKVRKSELADLLRGNVLLIENPSDLKEGRLVYKNAYCYGVSVAQYILDNDLADEVYVKATEDDVDINDPDQNETTEYLVKGVHEELVYGYGEYINCEDSPVIVNPFFSYRYWNAVIGAYTAEDHSETYIDEDGNSIPYWFTNGLSPTVIPELYEYLYTSHYENYYKDSTITLSKLNGNFVQVKDENGEPILRGGFQAKDEDGNFLYETDEHGHYLRDDYDRLIPVQELYSPEIADEQNSYFSIDPASLPIFQIAIEFKLTDAGLDATIINSSLKDSSNLTSEDDAKFNTGCQLCDIILLPYLSSSFKTDAVDENGDILGQIIVPDGSGASIHFNNGANDRSDAAYKALIYGAESSHLEQEARPVETQKLMFPMFGFLDNCESKGVMAVQTQGAAMSYIYADVSRTNTPYNIAYFNTKFREVENMVLVYGWYRYPLTKYAETLISYDLKYSYSFLNENELDYSSLASRYREFLINQYGITSTDQTLDHPVVNVNFMGAYRHYVLTLGVIYYRKSPLTSFKDAIKIVDELYNEGITNMTVSYKGWTQDALEVKLRRNVKVSSALGGKSGMKELENYLYAKGIDFYPELNISYTKGYKYSFGANKYTSRGVGNIVTKMYEYDLAKLQYDKLSKPSYIVSPKYYQNIVENYSSSYAKLGANGIYLSDLGNAKIGDYHKGRLLYSDDANVIMANCLDYFSKDYKVQLSAPFDYALSYASSIVNAPFTSTMYPIVNDIIPFYELVLSGIVDYSSVIINGTDDNSVDWFVAKAVESGANLYFQLSEEDNSVLLETDYTQYYRINYNQWKSTILDMYNRLDASGVAHARLVEHRVLSEGSMKISYVRYSNGLEYYINTNSRDVTYKGNLIKAYSWIEA